MNSASSDQSYRPELLQRRGELISWCLTLLLGVAWLVLYIYTGQIFSLIFILAVILLLSSLSISLSNWMDRRTVLQISDSGISFRNGLRNVYLDWKNVNEVRVFPAGWGERVQVIGDQAHFVFRTLGEVKVQGKIRGRMGFTQGDDILEQIINQSNLQAVEGSSEGYYYARH